MDVLSASFGDDKIAWYENDGSGSFSAEQIITTRAYGAISVHAADLDRDGDTDVLSASSWHSFINPWENDDKIAWYKNLLIDAGVDDFEMSIPVNYRLTQNFPNPFNPVTTIQFSVKEKCAVNLNVYNIQGRLVQNLVCGEYLPGSYEVTFNGSKLPSGIYFYRYQAGKFTDAKKMILLE